MMRDGKEREIPNWEEDIRTEDLEEGMIAQGLAASSRPTPASESTREKAISFAAVGSDQTTAAPPMSRGEDNPQDDGDYDGTPIVEDVDDEDEPAPVLNPDAIPLFQSDEISCGTNDGDDNDLNIAPDLPGYLQRQPHIITQETDTPDEDMIDDIANHFDSDAAENKLNAELRSIAAHKWVDGSICFLVRWSTGEEEWFDFDVLRSDHPKIAATYIIDNNVDPKGGQYSRWARLFLRELRKTVRRLQLMKGNPQENVELDDPGPEHARRMITQWQRKLRRVATSQPKSAKKTKQAMRSSMHAVEAANAKHRKRTKPGRNNRQMGAIKYGVEVPWSVLSALEMDEENGNTLWKDAIEKEVGGLIAAQCFRFLPKGSPRPGDPGEYQYCPLQLVFDVKTCGKRKARMVAGGHVTDASGVNTASSTVEPLSVRLLHLIRDKENLEVLCGDISQAFIQAYTKEKVFVRCGPEFGSYAGMLAVVERALYGMKGSSEAFHEHLAKTLRYHPDLGFKPTCFDRDVWIKDRGDGYDYICTHVDDFKIIAKEPQKYMDSLKAVYDIKDEHPPEYYLGNDYEYVDGHWNIGSRTYVKEAIDKIQREFGTLGKKKSPMATKDHPEDDRSAPLNAAGTRQFQKLTGIAQWLIQLGRYDIAYAVCALNRFNSAPRQGHMERMLRVFEYVKKHPNKKIRIDSRDPIVSPNAEPPIVTDFTSQKIPLPTTTTTQAHGARSLT